MAFCASEFKRPFSDENGIPSDGEFAVMHFGFYTTIPSKAGAPLRCKKLREIPLYSKFQVFAL